MTNDIKEFDEILKILTEIYGKEYVDNCKKDKNNKVNENLKNYLRLTLKKPSQTSIDKYLEEICKTNKDVSSIYCLVNSF